VTNVPNFQILIFGIFITTAFAFAIVASTFPASLLKFVLGLLAIFFAVLAFSMRYYYYIVIPFIHARGKAILLDEREPFFIAPNGNAIMGKDGGFTYATMFIRIPIYSSSTEMSEEERYDFSKLFSKLVSLSKNPIKITTQLNILNKDDYINKLRDKLNDAETRYNNILSKNDAKPEEIERAKGEATMWHNLLDTISNANSLIAVSYASVTAMGGDDEEALNLAMQSANEIMAGINSIYGVVSDIISTPELLMLIEPEYMIPFSTINQQIKGMR